MAAPATDAARIHRVLSVLATDPEGLGGLWLRGRAGPARDAVLAALPEAARLHPAMEPAALTGGLDLAATLAAGRAVRTAGLLARPGLWRLSAAERSGAGFAALLCAALDRGGAALLALDEGAEPGEAPPAALTERLGLFLATDGLRASDLGALPPPDAADIAGVTLSGEIAELAVAAALSLGIASLRAPLRTLAAARALAALDGAAEVAEAHLADAAGMTLAHLASPGTETAGEETAPPDPGTGDAVEGRTSGAPEDLERVVAAARAALPPEIQAALAAARAGREGQGAGAEKTTGLRGRPLPSRAGGKRGAARIDVVATLRTAAPWQGLRRTRARVPRAVHVTPGDIRLRRHAERAERCLVFLVDASGSQALARMAEAKGAVELLLAEAYRRRDHVSLVAFRGAGAELLLPPTRSLVQAKRRLAGLPGGGATPLASGLAAAGDVAARAARKGATPVIVLMTDGRANVTLDGAHDRARAGEDATRVARQLQAGGCEALVIDTGARPRPALGALAGALGGRYMALPRAGAETLSAAVGQALGPG